MAERGGHDTAALRRLAGVGAGAYLDHRVGDRVLTKEGFPGVVRDVHEGPGHLSTYFVTLDDAMGGGEYGPGELQAMPRQVAAVDPERVASADYPELGDILVQRPHLQHSVSVDSYLAGRTASARCACCEGAGEHHDTMRECYACDASGQAAEGPVPCEGRTAYATLDPDPQLEVEVVPDPQLEVEGLSSSEAAQPGHGYSYDWCRFRRSSRCHYPHDLDVEATYQAGYAVWQPVDRGFCPRVAWEDQQACPAPSEPGPSVPGGLTDATRSWESGGQRGGVPVRASLTSGAQTLGDGELGFHVHAAWSDVRAKARRIRSSGGVRILSSTGVEVVAQVRGDTSTYETQITRVPGRQQVGAWHCACAWGQHSWGRTGPWRRFEGRLCSHALATHYEAQARGSGGRAIREDPHTPDWARQPPELPRAASLRPAEDQHESSVRDELDLLAAARHAGAGARLRALVRGVLRTLTVGPEGVRDERGQPVDPRSVAHPAFHPTRGLRLASTAGADSSDAVHLLLPGEPSYDLDSFAGAGPNDPVDLSWLDDEEEPEPALPVATGDDDLLREATQDEARDADLSPEAREALWPQHVDGPDDDALGAHLLAVHQARLAGDGEGPDPFAHLKGGGGDPQVAAAAQEFLKTSLKAFTPAEKAMLIEEGLGTEASNLDERLDIRGTHYEALADARQTDDEDLLGWM